MKTRFFDICLFAGSTNFKNQEIKANVIGNIAWEIKAVTLVLAF